MRKAGAGAMDDGARAWIEGLLAGSPVARSIGLRFREIAPDRVVAELPFSTGNVTVGDIVHGGVIATLIDVAGAAASASGVGKGEATGGATSTLAISFLAPASGCDLVAEAVVVQRGRSQTVSDVSVRSPDGVLVARALVTSRIFRSKG